MLSVWKSLRPRGWVIFQGFALSIKRAQLPLPTPAFPGGADLTPCLQEWPLWTPTHRWHLPREPPQGCECHRRNLNFPLFTQEGRKSLALNCVGCWLLAATASSLTSHFGLGFWSAPSSRKPFKGDASCLKAALSGLVLTCRENRSAVPIRLLCSWHSSSAYPSKKAWNLFPGDRPLLPQNCGYRCW